MDGFQKHTQIQTGFTYLAPLLCSYDPAPLQQWIAVSNSILDFRRLACQLIYCIEHAYRYNCLYMYIYIYVYIYAHTEVGSNRQTKRENERATSVARARIRKHRMVSDNSGLLQPMGNSTLDKYFK